MKFKILSLILLLSGLSQFIFAQQCSSVVEDLKLCIDNSKIIVNSGEPIILKLSWANSSNNERVISRRSVYSVTVNDEKNKKLIPVFKQKQINNDDLETEMTKEDIEKFMRSRHPKSDNGQEGIHLRISANQTEADEIRLTETNDFDLSVKGKYKVTISKTIASLEDGKKIEFVIDDIEIRVK